MVEGCIYHSWDHMNTIRLFSFERPQGMVVEPTNSIDLTHMLPAAAQDRGMILLDVTYREPLFSGIDPFIIFDREGRILHRWPDGYIPGWPEIQEVSKGLL